MTRTKQQRSFVPCYVARTVAFLVLLGMSGAMHAQTFTVVHSFAGGSDGATPLAGLTIDRFGKLYGTTSDIEIGGGGGAFDLRNAGLGWTLSTLSNLQRQLSAIYPASKLVWGPDGALYGTTTLGGVEGVCDNSSGCGTVFRLQAPTRICGSLVCPWTGTVLYAFQSIQDGYEPGQIVFDSAGNIYGTTSLGGTSSNCGLDGCGTVFKLANSGGAWTKTTLYNFNGGVDGGGPNGGVILDAAGNLYGTAGFVYELSPSGGGWTLTILHTFSGEYGARGPLVTDTSGNLYGVAENNSGAGLVFELAQPGTWTYEVLSDSLPNSPNGGLVFDTAWNLYGTTFGGGAFGDGTAFELMHTNGSWTVIDLHDFTFSDGSSINGGMTFDANGNLYGTSQTGGTTSEICYTGCGTAWKLTP